MPSNLGRTGVRRRTVWGIFYLTAGLAATVTLGGMHPSAYHFVILFLIYAIGFLDVFQAGSGT